MRVAGTMPWTTPRALCEAIGTMIEYTYIGFAGCTRLRMSRSSCVGYASAVEALPFALRRPIYSLDYPGRISWPIVDHRQRS
jgi:hypothetical protein